MAPNLQPMDSPHHTSVRELGGSIGRGTLFPAFVAAVTALSMGYDGGVMSGSIAPMSKTFGMSMEHEGLIMGLPSIVAAFGAILASYAADMTGRIPATAITAAMLAAGPLIHSLAPSYSVALVGRCIVGVGVGFSFVVPPLYAAELSHPSARGTLVAMTEVLISVGVLLGYISALLLRTPGLSDEQGWRLVIGLAAVPPIMVVIACPWLPESPRWLAKQHRWPEVEAMLLRLYQEDETVESVAKSIRDSIEDEKSEVGWSGIFYPTPEIKKMIYAAFGLAFVQQASGCDAFVCWCPTILATFGVKNAVEANKQTIILGMGKLFGACVAGPFLDVVGRRSSVLLSCLGCSFITLAMAALTGTTTIPYLGIGLASLWQVVFEVGLGAGLYVVGTEIFPMNLRAKAVSCNIFIQRLTSGVVSAIFPGLVALLSFRMTFIMFSGISFGGFIWLYIWIVETAGLSLEESGDFFHRKDSQ